MPDFDARNAVPMISAGADTIVSIHDTVVLSGNAEDFFGGKIVTWEWDVGNTGAFMESDKDTFFISPAVFDTNFIVVMKVTDDDMNVGLDTLRVRILPNPPTAKIYAPPGGSIVSETFGLKGVGTDNGTLIKYEWDFGDGNWVESSHGDTIISLNSTG